MTEKCQAEGRVPAKRRRHERPGGMKSWDGRDVRLRADSVCGAEAERAQIPGTRAWT